MQIFFSSGVFCACKHPRRVVGLSMFVEIRYTLPPLTETAPAPRAVVVSFYNRPKADRFVAKVKGKFPKAKIEYFTSPF